ncbi:MmyB family transcriptional regulator [Demequina phytophila]|uniref:MmyB family transcriptional regulator n=1 Tax=Demequina phytophila TaxID=1638981 RepID=UPI0007844E8C|nr:hypothetical protein [Demequina phytophila]
MVPIDALLAEFVESLPATPAAVVDHRWDVVASNAVARAVSPHFTVGRNLAAATFLAESARRTLPEWGQVADRMAGLLAQPLALSEAAVSDAGRLREELARRGVELAAAPPELPATGHALTVTMEHPVVGRMVLTYELLRVTGADQTVILAHAERGTASEERLLRLARQDDPLER